MASTRDRLIRTFNRRHPRAAPGRATPTSTRAPAANAPDVARTYKLGTITTDPMHRQNTATTGPRAGQKYRTFTKPTLGGGTGTYHEYIDPTTKKRTVVRVPGKLT